MSTDRIDAHLHLWDRGVSDYAWLESAPEALRGSFAPEQAKAELDAAGIGRAVLVQAEDSLRDTTHLLGIAARHAWVAGVVGWVPLDDPPAAEAALDRWQQHPAFVGVRHLVHDDPRDDYLDLRAVRTSLGGLASRGLPFDVPDAWPRHLGALAGLAGAIPELVIVVDYLGKPPAGAGSAAQAYPEWADQLRRVSELPGTVAKVSGLHSAGHPLTGDALRRVWDTALDAFGPYRLMYGGDWPMTIPTGGYQATWQRLGPLIAELSEPERERLLGGTASAVYGLEAPTGREAAP